MDFLNYFYFSDILLDKNRFYFYYYFYCIFLVDYYFFVDFCDFLDCFVDFLGDFA